MMKYPIGIQAFDCLREEGYEYVDKTEMIYALTHQGSCNFSSEKGTIADWKVKEYN